MNLWDGDARHTWSDTKWAQIARIDVKLETTYPRWVGATNIYRYRTDSAR